MSESIRSFMNIVDENNSLEEDDREFDSGYTTIETLENLLERFKSRQPELEAALHDRRGSWDYNLGRVEMLDEIVTDIEEKIKEERESISSANTQYY